MSRVNMAYRRLLRVVHHRNTFQYSNGVFLNGTRTALRYYSKEGSKAGGSGKGSSSKPNNGGGGFFKKFVDSVKKSVKEDDVQESLKGFHEEREKMQQSYIVQQARQKLKDIKVGAEAAGSVGTEKTSESWTKVKSATSKVYQDVAETELGKKTHEVGAKLAEDLQKTAEELAKTDVGGAVKKGADIVKEDLVDDIVKQSNPYKAPDRIMKRSELVTDFSSQSATSRVIEPNEEAKGLVKTTQESGWKQKWDKWVEANPISDLYYSARIKYDESDNIVVRASRAVTDRIGDVVRGSVSQSDIGATLAEIQKIDPNFDYHNFLEQCKLEIIPSVLEAYMQGLEDVLKDWCHEPAFNVLSAVVKQRHEPGVKLECKVLEVRDVDLAMAKVMDQGPVMIITFHAQQLTRKHDEGGSFSELLENVVYVWALCRDQTVYDPKSAWRVLEFGIQSSGKMLA